MKIDILSTHDALWSATLSQLPHDVYHLPEYVALDARRTHTSPQAFLLQEDDKIFFAPYLLRSCSDVFDALPTEVYDILSPYGYPGILMNEAALEDADFPDLALQHFCRTLQAKNVCSAFLRLHPILSNQFTQAFQSDLTSKGHLSENGLSESSLSENGKTVSIDLTLDEDTIWAKTRRGHQSTINKCMRLGLHARTVPVSEYLDEFIDIYEETMNRVEAKDDYYFSRKYFEGLAKLGDRVHLGVVEFEDEIISACLFFESCNIVQAHLGGTKTEYLKQSPFNLLLHHMRLWAKARGNEYLHIGGGVGGKKDNLYTFKSGFSKLRHDFFTLRSVIDSKRYQELLKHRAKAINKSVEDLQRSQFFPAYRAS